MKKINYIPVILAATVVLSCTKSQFDEFDATTGGAADFTTFISVGNSLTQGYQDGGLHNEYQQQANSFPAIIAGQMGVAFLQPMVEGAGSGHKFLAALQPSTDITDIPADANWGAAGWNIWDKNTQYNNMGVSGVRLTDCVPTAGDALSPVINQVIISSNPFGGYQDFGTIGAPISYLQNVKASNATFFTNWLGNNDVLGWATAGGEDGATTIPGLGTINTSELTPVSVFRNKYDSILVAFQSMGAKGVCATLPDVTAIPYFTTVTLEAVGSDVWITEGPSSNNPGNVRLATNEDLILLTTKSAFNTTTGHGFIQANPLTHQEVLDKDEVIVVQNHTLLLNAEIRASAAANGNVAVVDMHAIMFELQAGMTFDGVAYAANYIEGGAFSLDGVHPNTRGYAIIANKFMEVINTSYGSNLRPVPVHNYKGIIFP